MNDYPRKTDYFRLRSILSAAPDPADKNDSQLAQEYRNWYYCVRCENMKYGEFAVSPVRKLPIDNDP